MQSSSFLAFSVMMMMMMMIMMMILWGAILISWFYPGLWVTHYPRVGRASSEWVTKRKPLLEMSSAHPILGSLGRARILVSTFKLLLLWHRSFWLPWQHDCGKGLGLHFWNFFHNIGSICESLDSKEDSNVECTHQSLATNAHTFRHMIPWNAWIAQ